MATIKRKKKQPQPIKISFGFIIFGFIFIYMLVRILISFHDRELSIFQVEESSYDSDFTKTGLALRQEVFDYCSKSGYVCYYIRDGEKVAKGSSVYSIDETGSMYDAIYDLQNKQENLLTEKDYNDISNQIEIFMAGFSASDFSEVYEFKYSLDNKVLELYEELALEQLTENSSFDSTFTASKASNSGIVTYYKDGFENYDINNLSSDAFDKTAYNRETLKTGDIVTAGSAVYKLVDSDSWKIAVELTKEEYDKITESDRVRFMINDSGKVISEDYETQEKGDSRFIIISMDRYMAEYVSERYLDITFVFSDTKGLKIPNSAIVEKEVYMIPKSFLTGGSGSDSEIYFNQLVLTETGETSVVQIAPTIFFTDDQFCYVNPTGVDEDAVLVQNDTGKNFSVATAGRYNLKGVYCVTQGTAIFRQVQIMISGDDYSIIEPNTSYGISAYDRIVLDGTTVTENQIIY